MGQTCRAFGKVEWCGWEIVHQNKHYCVNVIIIVIVVLFAGGCWWNCCRRAGGRRNCFRCRRCCCCFCVEKAHQARNGTGTWYQRAQETDSRAQVYAITKYQREVSFAFDYTCPTFNILFKKSKSNLFHLSLWNFDVRNQIFLHKRTVKSENSSCSECTTHTHTHTHTYTFLCLCISGIEMEFHHMSSCLPYCALPLVCCRFSQIQRACSGTVLSSNRWQYDGISRMEKEATNARVHQLRSLVQAGTVV